MWLSQEGTRWSTGPQGFLENGSVSGKRETAIPIALKRFPLNNGQTGTLRGIVASRAFEEGERVLQLPSSVVFSIGPEEDSSNGEHWAVPFAKKLIEEKRAGASSFFSEYIASLPEAQMTGLELERSWEVLKEVQYLPAISAIANYSNLISLTFKGRSNRFRGETDLAEWVWANTVVHSRTFRHEGERFMLPLIDLINHDFERENVQWVRRDDRSIDLAVNRRIEQGEQLYVSYGDRNSDDFLVYYGFVPDQNPFETFILFESTKEACTWYIDRFLGSQDEDARSCILEMAQEAALAEEQDSSMSALEISATGQVRVRCFVRRRVLHLTKKLQRQADGRMLAAFEAIHRQDPKAGPVPLRALMDRCCEILDTYPTTIEHDLLLLSSHTDATLQVSRDVLAYRIAKKQVLRSMSQLCKGNLGGTS
eukprot:scaffold1883_cov396-Prasinococcus_capsulatus_cf.AAC.15